MANTKLKIRTDLAKKSQSATTIYVAYAYREKTKFYSTKQKIELELWNTKTGQVKKGNDTEKAKTINAIINAKKAEIDGIIDEALFRKKEPTFEYVDEQLDAIYNPKPVVETNKDFFYLFEKFITESGSERGKSSIKQYKNTLKILKDFQERKKYNITLDSIELTFHKEFVKYCEKELDQAPNTIGKAIKNIKTFMREMTEKGINTNLTFQEKKFKKPSAKTDIIYLTKQELEDILSLDLSDNPGIERVRDAFIFECATGLRYSDLANLNPYNIKADHIDFTNMKTRDRLIIPLNKYAKLILEKYNNKLPKILVNQAMNRYLKEIGMLAGVTHPIQIVKYRAGKRIEQVLPKYQLITTHTGRRTFITQALERGMRPEVIMRITGHKDLKVLMNYVKITDQVVREEMMKAWNG